MSLITTSFDATSTADEVVEGVDLRGIRAVVTGGASGIGVETARSLARAGADVVLAVRDTAAGDRVAADIAATTGRPVEVAPVDLLDRRTVAAFTQAWTGPLHLLVLNAGQLGTLSPIAHISPKDWDKVLAVNLTANFRLLRAFDPWLRLSPAADVVALTSSVGASPRANWGTYAVSKAALDSLLRIYGQEVSAISQIRIHIINPGATRTLMRENAFPGEDPATVKPPEDVAAMIVSAIAAPRA